LAESHFVFCDAVITVHKQVTADENTVVFKKMENKSICTLVRLCQICWYIWYSELDYPCTMETVSIAKIS